MSEARRWRFHVADIDDCSEMVDAEGGPNGDLRDAEFIGTSEEAENEGDRRSNLWEQKTGRLAYRITRESYGKVHSQKEA